MQKEDIAAANKPLSYPLDTRPDTGEMLDVAPGVRWLRLPLPMQLSHINVWLLDDGDGWALVDTGLYTRDTREIWQAVLEQDLDGRPLSRVLVTHLHPDHVGFAGWLTRKFDVDLWMSRDEYLLCRVLVADTDRPAPPEGIRFYRNAGFPAEALDHYIKHFGSFGRVVSPLPEAYHRLRDGMALEIGDHVWEVIVGRGHSPEHACLLCRDLNLLISGDQILPSISSNISVWPTEPTANPLEHWFESIEKFSDVLPPDVLVLPAHGKPFTGVHGRLQQLRSEHESGLAALRQLCREPQRAIDVFPALFKAKITQTNLMMATGEAVSHLNYLIERGEMTVSRDSAGVRWYRLV